MPVGVGVMDPVGVGVMDPVGVTSAVTADSTVAACVTSGVAIPMLAVRSSPAVARIPDLLSVSLFMW